MNKKDDLELQTRQERKDTIHFGSMQLDQTEDRVEQMEGTFRRIRDLRMGQGANRVTISEKENIFALGKKIDFVGTMTNSTKNPTTDTPDDWIQVTINGVDGHIPFYASS